MSLTNQQLIEWVESEISQRRVPVSSWQDGYGAAMEAVLERLRESSAGEPGTVEVTTDRLTRIRAGGAIGPGDAEWLLGEVERLSAEVEGAHHDITSLMGSLNGEVNESERLRNIVTGCPVCSELERNIRPAAEPKASPKCDVCGTLLLRLKDENFVYVCTCNIVKVEPKATRTLVVPNEYMPRVTKVISQGLGTLGRPRGVAHGAEADELLRNWCSAEKSA